MKRLPNYIIVKQAYRYLSDKEKAALTNLLSKFDIKHKHFFNCLMKHFDIEVFRTNPLIWQDIWLYNYIKYDIEKGLGRSGLIAKYEKEVFIDDDAEFYEKRETLNSLKLKV